MSSSEDGAPVEDAHSKQQGVMRQFVRECREATPSWVWPEIDVLELPDPPVLDTPMLPPPSKYMRLHLWFCEQNEHEVSLSTEALANLIDGDPPARVYELLQGRRPPRSHAGWWENNPRKAHCRAWVNAGYGATGLTSPSGEWIFRYRRDEPWWQKDTRAEVLGRRVGPLRHIEVCATFCTYRIAKGLRLDGQEPVGVYITHSAVDGLFKVGIGSRPENRAKAQNSRKGRLEIVQTITVASRDCARAVEAVALNLTEPWRVIGNPWDTSGGRTEFWGDTGPLPDLAEIADRINPNIRLENPGVDSKLCSRT